MKRFLAVLLFLLLLYRVSPAYVNGEQRDKEVLFSATQAGTEEIISDTGKEEDSNQNADTEGTATTPNTNPEETSMAPDTNPEGTNPTPDTDTEEPGTKPDENQLNGPGAIYGEYTITETIDNSADTTIKTSGEVYEVTGDSERAIIVESADCVLIATGVTREYTTSRLQIKGNSNVTLYLAEETVNTFACTTTTDETDQTQPQAGIYVEQGSTLTIEGPGALNATGATYGAGIGASRILPDENAADATYSSDTKADTDTSRMLPGENTDEFTTGGTITISSGNIKAQSGAEGTSGIIGDAIIITGGSVYSTDLNGKISMTPAPTNGTAAVYLTGIKLIDENKKDIPNAEITQIVSESITGTYCAKTDESGAAWLWLPNGTYEFLLNNPNNQISVNYTMVVDAPKDTAEYDPATDIAVIEMPDVQTPDVQTPDVQTPDAEGSDADNKTETEIPNDQTPGTAEPGTGNEDTTGTTDEPTPNAEGSDDVGTLEIPDDQTPSTEYATASEEQPQISFTKNSQDKVYGNLELTLAISQNNAETYEDVKWYRESAEKPGNTKDTFDAGYAAAASGNSGEGGAGNTLNLISSNDAGEYRYSMDTSKNGRYWIQIHSLSASNSDIYLVEYMDVDNIYTPVDVYVQDWDASNDTELKPYTKLTMPDDAPYGIPYDLNGSTILKAPSNGYDTITYQRNENMSADIWTMTVPTGPFASTEGSADTSAITLNRQVDNSKKARSADNNTTSKYYTVVYAMVTYTDTIDLSNTPNKTGTGYVTSELPTVYTYDPRFWVEEPTGFLTFNTGANGKTYNIKQTGIPNKTIPNEQKYGSSMFRDIIVNTGVNVTLVISNIHLIGSIRLNGTAKVTLILEGTNFVRSSIRVPSKSEITIDSLNAGSNTDKLTMPSEANSSSDNAKIGGVGNSGSADANAAGKITINGGVINITARSTGAGIGGGGSTASSGGNAGNGGSITINGGTISVTQYGSGNDKGTGFSGAGIGGGGGVDNKTAGAGAGDLLITGGSVTIKQYTRAAGIGAGTFGPAGNINITGGNIKVEVNRIIPDLVASGEGAGIGTAAGDNAGTGSINISGGTISSVAYGTGIGRVHGNSTTFTINITGGNIYAKGEMGPGIGSWITRCDSPISITGGTIIAESDKGTGIGNQVVSPAYLNLGADANVRAYSGSADYSAFNVRDNTGNGYYVNASLATAISTNSATTMYVYENGKSDKLLKTLTLPANYRHFGYSSDLSSPRTDNVFAQNGTITGKIIRTADDSPEIYSVNTRNGYANHNGTLGALPVKLNPVGFFLITEKYVDIEGKPIANIGDNVSIVINGAGYTRTIPSLDGYSALGYYVGNTFTGTYTPGAAINALPVSGNATVYFVYQLSNQSAHTLTVSEMVAGDFADKERQFEFTVYFYTGSDGSPLNPTEAFPFKILDSNGVTEGTLTAVDNTITFKLKDLQAITIENIPESCWVRVLEEDLTSGTNPIFAYNVTFVDGDSSANEQGGDTGLREMNGNRVFKFTNERYVITSTGIDTGDLKALIMLPLLALLITALIPALKPAYRRVRRAVKN